MTLAAWPCSVSPPSAPSRDRNRAEDRASSLLCSGRCEAVTREMVLAKILRPEQPSPVHFHPRRNAQVTSPVSRAAKPASAGDGRIAGDPFRNPQFSYLRAGDALSSTSIRDLAAAGAAVPPVTISFGVISFP